MSAATRLMSADRKRTRKVVEVERSEPSEAVRLRARQLAQSEIAFLDHPSFRGKEAESPEVVLQFAEREESGTSLAELPERLPAHLRRLCEVPLLSAEQERELFRRMNYLKYLANARRARLREDSATEAQVAEIERLVQAAEQLRNRIVRANLRLVMSIVKHFISEQNAFDDLLSEGMTALLRAADKFDFGRGFRFSTYVTKVVRREVYRAVMAQKRHGERFATGDWEHLGERAEDGESDLEDSVDLSSLRGDLMSYLGNLDPREQLVLRERFGFVGAARAPSLNELGRRLGVSKERVRQLELRAIRKLQKAFHERRGAARANATQQ